MPLSGYRQAVRVLITPPDRDGRRWRIQIEPRRIRIYELLGRSIAADGPVLPGIAELGAWLVAQGIDADTLIEV